MKVHFEGTLKRGYSVESVFTQFEKTAGKSKLSKGWKIMQTDSTVTVDFGDGTQFTLLFNGKFFDGDCPTEHDSEEPIDKKSADYQKMKMLYSLKSVCKEYSVTDEGTAWFRYLESMKYKAYFRHLTEDEMARVKTLYDRGANTPEKLLATVVYDDLKLKSVEEYRTLGKMESVFSGYDSMGARWEQWVIRTCLFKGKRPKTCWAESGGMDPLSFAVVGLSACVKEMWTLTKEPDHIFSTRGVFGAPHGILRRMLYDDFVPAVKQADDFEKCVLAYRTFVSAVDYVGFQFVGLAE
ncbi:MAG: hypothetical protein IK130_02405 [Oscillospiraceae bacterium]|nr:hypothetical protein [Oscillospiraceae bacterium]